MSRYMPFLENYYHARNHFRKAIPRPKDRLVSLSVRGDWPPDDLTIDVAWFGSARPRNVFVHSCGLHGVEGFAGSAIQVCWLQKGIPVPPEDSAIVLVHALNPYGMRWVRRFNENNVDLNRNFREPGEYTPEPIPYWDILDAFLNPPTCPSRDWFYQRAAWLVLRYGMPTLRQAVAGGQCLNPKGLFFGGSKLEEGPARFQEFMRTRLAGAEKIVAIDIHTGLGRFGEDKLLVDGRYGGTEALQTMTEIFGERIELLSKEGIAYAAPGAQQEMYLRSFPNAQIYFVSQEFGTYSPLRVLAALRDENRFHWYSSPYGSRVGYLDPTKETLLEVFNPKDEKWRQTVLARGRAVIQQGLRLAFADDQFGNPGAKQEVKTDGLAKVIATCNPSRSEHLFSYNEPVSIVPPAFSVMQPTKPTLTTRLMRRLRHGVSVVASLAALAGCGRNQARTQSDDHTLIFRGTDGRVLTAEDLRSMIGTFRWEVAGGRPILPEAESLHQQGRQAGTAGDHKKALMLLERASMLAPDWPYPVYDLAWTYLLLNDPDNARKYYRKTMKLEPRGFFTSITAIDTLEREQKGDLPEGTYLAYVTLESVEDPGEKARLLQLMTERAPNFAPAWKEFAYVSQDEAERRAAIEKGLAAHPDAETKGILLINKAWMLDAQGDHDRATQVLQELAMSPESTLATQHLANMILKLQNKH